MRQYLAFGRRRDDKEVNVGRFTVLIKLVGDYMTKYDHFDGTNLTGPKKALSQVHLLPAEEPNFKWRIRIDLRAALDAPLNRTT